MLTKKYIYIFLKILTAIVETIIKIITQIKIYHVINNTNQIILLKYKNFANNIYSKNLIVYQFECFFTNEKTKHIAMHINGQRLWFLFYCFEPPSPLLSVEMNRIKITKRKPLNTIDNIETFECCCNMLRLLNALATCSFVFVTCWLSLISKKVVTSTKLKKNQKTVMKKQT